MAVVTFHGDLKRFESEPFELEVNSFPELMSGLLTQIDGLRDKLKSGYYRLKIGKKYYTSNEVKANPNIQLSDDTEIHLTPVIVGAGKGMNVVNIIIGVVLIAVSWYAGGAAGWGYLGATGYGMATSAFVLGASMVLSGVIGLLTQPPAMDNNFKEGEKEKSTSFSNLKNLTPQGRPIPLLYGEMMVSMILISQGVEAFDDERIKKMEEATAKHNEIMSGGGYSPPTNWDYSEKSDRDDEEESSHSSSDSDSSRDEPDRYGPDTYDDGDEPDSRHDENSDGR
ncbi:tail assembly protein [Pasteurella sp. PK-2025]|uniref:tail assembly protein n=1 Tax=Pasteurella sp. PK-2025 TaxID=3413133 RepID=UPI003C710370